MADETRLVVDFQAFFDNDKNFIVKEFAIVDITNRAYVVLHFLPPYAFERLNHARRKSNDWLMENFHRLSWSDGEIEYDTRKIVDVILSFNPQMVFVKSLQKHKFLTDLLSRVSNFKHITVLDIEREGCCEKPKKITNFLKCPIKTHANGDSFVKCALHNAISYNEWLNKPLHCCDYTREKDRLDSFGKVWSDKIDFFSPARSIAKIGFYYVGSSDVIKCAWCGIQLSNLMVKSNIVDLHNSLAPRCPSLIDYVPNVPLALEKVISRMKEVPGVTVNVRKPLE